MKLTSYTDYALRTLLYLALNRDRMVTIQDIADAHGIAKSHLAKVVHQLGMLALVETVRGRHGGPRLGKDPSSIDLGGVVRSTESDFFIAECFDPEKPGCIYSTSCALKGVLGQAHAAFLGVLDDVTLDTLISKPDSLGRNRAPPQTTPVQFLPRIRIR